MVNMDKNNNIYIKTGFAIAAFCVLLGAFASHFLKDLLNDNDLGIFDTGTKYLFYHALAIIIVSLNSRKFNQGILDLSIFLFFGGMLFFTGSLYLLATRTIWGGDDFEWLGALTPIGGVLFISGWFMLIVKGLKNSEDKITESRAKRAKRKIRKLKRERSIDNKNETSLEGK
jgi:uncharacterized membrane protein YgdD (TMEM256/DUF423 family)